jgi:tripartite-type tricarboxylate transporter receptor subunit TctC
MDAGTRVLKVICIALGAIAVVGPSRAQSPEPFFRGKTINVVIGFDVGGSLDVYARLAARHLVRFIPGEPTLVPQNMPGASGLNAANYLYRAAPKDGTTIGVIHPNSAFAQAIGMPSIQYDVTRFNWIGRLTSSTSVFYTWHSSPTKTMQDLMSRETLVGGIGPLTDGAVFSRMTNHVLGTRVKMIQGYKGVAAVKLAMERGEVEGLFDTWEGMRSLNVDWIRDGKINLVAQYASARHPEIPQVPAVIEAAQSDEHRQVVRLFLSTSQVGRTLLLPPDVPPERVSAIRLAFSAMLKDPEFLAEAKSRNLDLEPLDGPALQKLNQDTFDTSPTAIEIARTIMKN